MRPFVIYLYTNEYMMSIILLFSFIGIIYTIRSITTYIVHKICYNKKCKKYNPQLNISCADYLDNITAESLSAYNTNTATDMSTMFSNCSSSTTPTILSSLDLSND